MNNDQPGIQLAKKIVGAQGNAPTKVGRIIKNEVQQSVFQHAERLKKSDQKAWVR